jgi:hypothetical protein
MNFDSIEEVDIKETNAIESDSYKKNFNLKRNKNLFVYDDFSDEKVKNSKPTDYIIDVKEDIEGRIIKIFYYDEEKTQRARIELKLRNGTTKITRINEFGNCETYMLKKNGKRAKDFGPKPKFKKDERTLIGFHANEEIYNLLDETVELLGITKTDFITKCILQVYINKDLLSKRDKEILNTLLKRYNDEISLVQRNLK